MIICYSKTERGIVSKVVAAGENVPADTMWVDMLDPTQEEEKTVKAQLGIVIPSHEEVWENQVLNRLYKDKGFYYMNAAIITKMQSPYPEISPVTFILGKDCLITVRMISPTSFKQCAQRIMQNPDAFVSSSAILEALLEEIVTRVAHNSEVVVSELDQLSHRVFDWDHFDVQQHTQETQKWKKDLARKQIQSQTGDMKAVLKQLGAIADLNSKINESLHSIGRLLKFFLDSPHSDEEVRRGIHALITDVEVLAQQTQFLSDKVTFQLDATLGMINVEQNIIIKIFSVVAVFFMPPTLVSSIYGMNFQVMPELHWVMGYPFAILLMITFALAPYVYFRRKGWL